jgi:hypothetical protein
LRARTLLMSSDREYYRMQPWNACAALYNEWLRIAKITLAGIPVIENIHQRVYAAASRIGALFCTALYWERTDAAREWRAALA